MIFTQLILDSTISANWVIAVILSILAFLLVRILNRIEAKQEEHDERIRNVEREVGILKSKD